MSIEGAAAPDEDLPRWQAALTELQTWLVAVTALATDAGWVDPGPAPALPAGRCPLSLRAELSSALAQVNALSDSVRRAMPSASAAVRYQQD